MSLFDPGTDERDELAALLEHANLRLSGRDRPWPRSDDPMAERVIASVQEGRLPPGALALVAGGCGAFDTIKDYGLRRYWELALTPSRSPAIAAAVRRVGLIGACGQFWDVIQRDRLQLYEWRGTAEVDALRLAVDAIWGARREALDALVALAAAQPTRAWLGWLAECAQRAAGVESIRMAPPSDPMAVTIPALAEARDLLLRHASPERGEAWAALAQVPAPPPSPVPAFDLDSMPPAQRPLMAEMLAELARDHEEEARAWGVFRGRPPAQEIQGPLLSLGWYTLVGFRQLYGAELAQSGALECAAWLASGTAVA